jgi:hypothetical protein
MDNAGCVAARGTGLVSLPRCQWRADGLAYRNAKYGIGTAPQDLGEACSTATLIRVHFFEQAQKAKRRVRWAGIF